MRLLEARAHYDAVKLPECIRTLQRALHVSPHSVVVRHNLSLALLKSAKGDGSEREIGPARVLRVRYLADPGGLSVKCSKPCAWHCLARGTSQ